MSVVIFIIVLVVLIVSHEFGHFITAKISGIVVEEFGLGLPPRIKGYMWRGTLYSINWLPFGGFVRIAGEDGESSSLPSTIPELGNSMSKYEGKRFTDKPRVVQALVVVAGIVCNIILAFILIWIAFMVGLPVSSTSFPEFESRMTNNRVAIVGVLPGSPADLAKVQNGSSIISLSAGDDSVDITTPTQVQEFVATHVDDDIVLQLSPYANSDTNTKINIDTETENVTLRPVINESGKPAIGIKMDQVGDLKLPPHLALMPSIKTSSHLLLSTASGLWHFLSGLASGDGDASSVTGPVGIAGIVGDAADTGLGSLLLVSALLSFSLAIINLVPFPALDGGRLLFIIIEGIKGSPIKASTTNIVNTAGFAILILLMLAVTYKDIINIIAN